MLTNKKISTASCQFNNRQIFGTTILMDDCQQKS